jgi:hypothetical protein
MTKVARGESQNGIPERAGNPSRARKCDFRDGKLLNRIPGIYSAGRKFDL